MAIVSRRAAAADRAFEAVKSFYFGSRYGERRGDPTIADFTFGNPHEMPLDGLVTAIREGAVPLDENWFAYKTSEEAPQAFLADAVGKETDGGLDGLEVEVEARRPKRHCSRHGVSGQEHRLVAEPGWLVDDDLVPGVEQQAKGN